MKTLKFTKNRFYCFSKIEVANQIERHGPELRVDGLFTIDHYSLTTLSGCRFNSLVWHAMQKRHFGQIDNILSIKQGKGGKQGDC